MSKTSKTKKAAKKQTKIVLATVTKNAKHNKNLPVQKSSRAAMTKIIKESKGRFFTCTHVDKDGNPRTMNAIKRNIESPSTELGYITVYSMLDKGLRNINPQTITDLSFGGVHYKAAK
jgi:hypothetical protein